MSANPYAPPVAEVADVPRVESQAEPPFFAVSTTKLLVMSMCTMTFYQVYWFYQNWARIKARNGSSIVPALRALFGVLFCYSCFSEIRNVGEKSGVPNGPSAGVMALGWIVCTVLWKLPDPYWWVALGAIFFMLPMQSYANAVNEALAPGHDKNKRFTLWNWLIMVPGGLLLILAAIGTVLPSQ